jgi:hypothetical protein
MVLANNSKLENMKKEYQAYDFKVLCTTWNMGQKNHSIFKDCPDQVFEDVGTYHLIAICV